MEFKLLCLVLMETLLLLLVLEYNSLLKNTMLSHSVLMWLAQKQNQRLHQLHQGLCPGPTTTKQSRDGNYIRIRPGSEKIRICI